MVDMIKATPLASEQITQEDREAAHRLMLNHAGDNWRGLLKGEEDRHTFVQAFARHRIAALSASPAPSGQGVSGEVEPKPCWNLNCTHSDLVVERIHLFKGSASPRAVECQCGARGPEAATDAEAIAAWNAAPAPSCAPGEVATTVRQTDPAAADYGEHFLTAHVSADGSLVGIDHPCDAVWSDVLRAHVALRDRINERIEAQDGCPFKPRVAPIPKTIDQAAERASAATGLAVSVRRSNADTQSHAPLSFRIHVEAPNGRSWTARAGMNRDDCKEALFMLASVAALAAPAPSCAPGEVAELHQLAATFDCAEIWTPNAEAPRMSGPALARTFRRLAATFAALSPQGLDAIQQENDQ